MELSEHAAKLFRTVRELGELKFFGESADLSRTEYRLVREIVSERERGGDIISSELARRLGLTRAAVSQIVTKLEAREVVVRVPAERDKKIAYIRLSDKTLKQYETQCVRIDRMLARAAERFGQARLRTLSEECREFLCVLKDVLRENGPSGN